MSEKLQQNNVGATKTQKIQQNTGKEINMQNQQNQNQGKSNNMQKASINGVTGQQKDQTQGYKLSDIFHKKEVAEQQNYTSPLHARISQNYFSRSIHDAARIAINECFDRTMGRQVNVNAVVISFVLKDEIPCSEWDASVHAMLERTQRQVNRVIGRTQFVWLHKNDVTYDGNIPVYDVIFMNGVNPDYLSWKKYYHIIKQHFLWNSTACCKKMRVRIPAGYSAPGYVEISSRARNYISGAEWLEGFASETTAFYVVGFGGSLSEPIRTFEKSEGPEITMESLFNNSSDNNQEPGKRAM